MRTRLTTSWLWLAVVAACSSAGCSSSHVARGSASSGPPGLYASSTASASARPRMPSLPAPQVVALPSRDEDFSLVDLWSHYAVWGGSARPLGRPDHVTLYDLATHRERVIARTSYPGGRSDWARGSGHYVVVSDNREIDEGSDGTHWRIRLVDLETGRTRLLDEDRTTTDRLGLPGPQIQYPWIAWQVPDSSSQTWEVRLMDLRSDAVTRPVRGVRLQDIALDGQWLLTLRQAPGGRQDIWRQPVAGGPAAQVTSSGKVGRFSAGAGKIAYYQTPSVAELTTDASSVWTAPVDGTTGPTKVFDGNGSNMVVGDGFAAWFTNHGTVAGSPGSETPPRMLTARTATAARLAADGRRLLYGVSLSDGKRFALRLASFPASG